MAFIDELAQTLGLKTIVDLTEGDNFLTKIARFLGINNQVTEDEAAKTLVDFIMSANDAQIKAVTDGLAFFGKVNESVTLDEGMKDFFDKFNPKLKMVIFAALMIVPKVMGDPEIIHDLKIAKDKAVINYGQDQMKNVVKSAPQAYLDLLKDMKDKYADEAGATEEETKEKLVRFIKGKTKEIQKNKEELSNDITHKIDSTIAPVKTAIDTTIKNKETSFKNFMQSKFPPHK